MSWMIYDSTATWNSITQIIYSGTSVVKIPIPAAVASILSLQMATVYAGLALS